MERLSVTIIACNEADRIGRAIQSVSFADEVLLVDSGSTDDTVRIATALGARVIQTDWPGYRAQKNRALTWAQHNWVLGLDADEWVSPILANSIQAALRSPTVFGFEINRLGVWMGTEIHHGVWRPDRSVRLFDRRRGSWSGGSVHERVQIDGRTERLTGDLMHDPYRDLSEQLQSIDRYARLFVNDAITGNKKAYIWDVVFRPFAHLVKALLIRRGVLDGVRGLCLAGLGAAAVMLKWGMLYLRQESK